MDRDRDWSDYQPPNICEMMGLGLPLPITKGASGGSAPPPPTADNLLWGSPDGLFWGADRLTWGP